MSVSPAVPGTISGTISGTDGQRALLEKALREIKKLKQQVSEQEQRRHEAIAIVGMSCRYPGSQSPEGFWQSLVDGRHCITDMHQQRWNMDALYDPDPDAPGKIYTRALGIVQDPEYFDADFFGIAPREAEDIDPQHRLLLEVSHEALERSGYSLASLADTSTGVFVGISGQDYAHLGSRLGQAEGLTPWHGTGNALSAAPGRISYLFNWHGPCLAVDTACSSSLVALHLACQSLRSGESSLALVGGVHLIFNPATTIIFAKARMLSPDGACKTFAADANGYVRSEGCGVLVLKRLSEAERDNDTIIAVIKGSAVNQDGKSQGFTAPSESAQEAVLRAALTQAQLKPADIAYLEAHGTGTPLGDPIELAAADNVYTEGRSTPLLVGACKTNIGHSEAAAGLAGVIKSALALQHNFIPPHLHFDKPNPYVSWAQMKLKVVTTGQTFPAGYARARAGVSAFGFTGTNAHAILESAPAETSEGNDSDWWPNVLTVSAKTPGALSQALLDLADAVDTWGASSAAAMRNTAFTRAVGRDHYRYRACIAGQSQQHWGRLLRECAAQPLETSTTARLHFLFDATAKEGVFWVAKFYRRWPLLEQQLLAVSADFEAVTGRSLMALLDNSIMVGSPPLSRHLQASLQVSLQVSCQFVMATLWTTLAGNPARLIGEGYGLLAAACSGGVFTFHDMLMMVRATADDAILDTGSLPPLALPRISLYTTDSNARLSSDVTQESFWRDHLAASSTLSNRLSPLSEAHESFFSLLPAVALAEPAAWLENSLQTLYLQGVDIKWKKVWDAIPARRICLPTYPFARKRFWNETLRDPALKSAFPAEVQSWLYELQWQSVTPSESVESSALWHIITDAPLQAQALKEQFAGRGQKALVWVCRETPTGPRFQCKDSHIDEVDSITTLLSCFAENCNGQPVHCIFLPLTACASQILQTEAYRFWSTTLLNLAQQLTAMHARLWMLTEGAYHYDGQHRVSPFAALMMGFAKVLSLETAEIFRGHYDLEADSLAVFKRLPDLLGGVAHVASLSVRASGLYEQRLERLTAAGIPFSERPVQVGRYYVIVGGTGAIGLAVAQWLVENGATHIALLSRHAGTNPAIEALMQKCRGVRNIAVDVCDEAALAGCFQRLRDEHPIVGVIHAAGLFDLTPLRELTPQKMFQVMDNKALGITHLDRVSAIDTLDCFIGFSSIASVWGSAGNFHYSAANQVVDAVIQHRRLQGKPGMVVNWGPWQASGMVTEDSKSLADQRGLLAMDKSVACKVFVRLFNSDRRQTIVADIHWEKLYPLLSLTSVASMVQAMAPRKKAADVSLDQNDLDFKQHWSTLPEQTREKELLTYLRHQLARALHTDAEQIDITQPLINMGIDSLMAVEFRQRVTQVTQVDIPVVIVLGGADLQTLAKRLSAQAAEQSIVADVEEILEGVL